MKILSQKTLRLALPYIAAFALPPMLFLCVCALTGVAPFGGRTLLILDMYSQYMPFLGHFQRMVLEGESWFYSLSASLGGNLFTLGATYLFSPLNALILLFPRAALPDAILSLILVKTGLCGLTAFVFLNDTHRRGLATLIFSTTYALMGYIAAYFFNVMWLDGVFLLPLVVMGIRRIVSHRNPGLYLVSLALALLTNYYMGYMLCLFSVLFFAYCCLTATPQGRQPGWFRQRALSFVLASLAAAGLAAFSLLPTALSLVGTKAVLDTSLFVFETNFRLPDIILMLMTGSFSDSRPINHLPFIFCGALITALAVLYFFNRKISIKEKLLSGALVVVLIIGFYIVAFNLVWHALNPPSSFPFRQSFLFAFLLIWLAYRCYTHTDGIHRWHVLGVAGFFALMFFLMEAPPLGQRLVDVLWMCAGCGLLFVWATGKRFQKAALWALAILQCAHLVVNGAQVMEGRQQSTPSGVADYQAVEQAGAEALAALREYDGELYRLDMPGLHGSGSVWGTNSPMLFSYPGVTFFSSTQQVETLAFMRKLGYATNRSTAIYPSNHVSDVVDSLLGVRYVVSDIHLPHKQYPVVLEAGDLWVYENTYALPLGFAASADVLTAQFEENDTFSAINEIYATIAGGGFEPIFVPLPLDVRTMHDGISLHYQSEAQVDGPVFAFHGKEFPWAATAEFVYEGYVLSQHDLIFTDSFPLGDYGPGDEVELLAMAIADYPPDDFILRLYQQDLEAFDEVIESIAEYGAVITRHTDAFLSGSITLPEDRPYLLLTLPYDPQWKVWVDGREVVPSPAFGPLMAIEMTPGEHTFEMRYTPRGFAAGVAISLGTLGILMLYVLWNRYRAKKKQLRR
ncbi:MAG: YfhO family protein [Clostridia bacterium]|nr:YfhO family protein [Clostridia bacterium]